MDHSKNAPTNDQNKNPMPISSPPPPPPLAPSSSNLTRDQEHEIMVSALLQVISNSGGDSSSTNLIADVALPSVDAGPCPLCENIGCHRCAFPWPPEEIKKEKKHKGVRKKPSGNWSAEIWDPNMKVKRWLGTFPTVEMAALAYDEAAAELVGGISASSKRTKNQISGHRDDSN